VAKYVIFVATMLAAWLIASPARAEAPLCDQRGATTMAPAPQLQQMQLSIDVGAQDPDCDPLKLLRAYAPDRTPTWDPPAVDPLTLPPCELRFVPGEAALEPADVVSVLAAHGVRDRVDRPPRR
jgi:hypothetical protein